MNEETNEIKRISIGLLGISPVGKSCILNSFMGGNYLKLDMINKNNNRAVKIIETEKGKKINVIVYDTPGQERFLSFAEGLIRSLHGIVLIFDLTNRDTFNNIDRLMKFIEENSRKPNVVLFGNKADDIDRRQVTVEEAENLAKKYNIKYFETSAKTNMNINEGFNYIVNICYDKMTERYENFFELKDEKEDKHGCMGKKKKNKNKKGK